MPETEININQAEQERIHVLTFHENAILARFVASRRKYLVAKRAVDIAVSMILLIVLTCFLPILALIIKLDSPGPVFFKQRRMGLNGKIFWCFKFRTMYVNENADERPAEENDTRVTGFGKWLRRTKIDELPQLLNVMLGTMSLVGPRPHMLSDCDRFSFVISSYKFRTLVKPGITGLAQVKGYRGPAMDYESIWNRYYYDAVYIRKANAVLDLKILFYTIGIVFRFPRRLVVSGP